MLEVREQARASCAPGVTPRCLARRFVRTGLEEEDLSRSQETRLFVCPLSLPLSLPPSSPPVAWERQLAQQTLLEWLAGRCHVELANLKLECSRELLRRHPACKSSPFRHVVVLSSAVVRRRGRNAPACHRACCTLRGMSMSKCLSCLLQGYNMTTSRPNLRVG